MKRDLSQRWPGYLAWLLPPFALGTLLRLWHLPAQVLSDDELFAVRVALRSPLGEILTTYHPVDNSIPLTALFHLLFSGGLRLSETAFRLPSLLCGLAVLVLFPLWAERRLDRATAIAFAWLLALSPALVFYSRIGRSYMPIVLAGGCAAAAFEAWWRRSGAGRGAAVFCLCAALAAWLHLGAAPFVAAPFVFAAGALLVPPGAAGLEPSRRPGLGRLAALAGATALACAVFLVPAGRSLLLLIRDKHQSIHPRPAVFAGVAELLAGSGLSVVAALFWLVAAVGLVFLLRRDRALAAYSAVLAGGQLAGILLLSPVGIQYPLIFNRYLVIALPIVLLWVAAALARLALASGSSWIDRLRVMAAAAVILLLALSGPFADPALRRSPFAHHDDYMAFYTPRARLAPGQLPEPYRALGSSAPGAVLEYPWMPMWRTNRAFYLYQEVHGREVVVAPPRPLLWDARLGFRNLAPGNPEGFLASRAHWLVVHRDLGAEEHAIPDVYQPPRPGILPRFLRVFRRFGGAMGERLEREWGPPDLADPRVRIWDLQRVRRARTPPL